MIVYINAFIVKKIVKTKTAIDKIINHINPQKLTKLTDATYPDFWPINTHEHFCEAC